MLTREQLDEIEALQRIWLEAERVAEVERCAGRELASIEADANRARDAYSSRLRYCFPALLAHIKELETVVEAAKTVAYTSAFDAVVSTVERLRNQLAALDRAGEEG